MNKANDYNNVKSAAKATAVTGKGPQATENTALILGLTTRKGGSFLSRELYTWEAMQEAIQKGAL